MAPATMLSAMRSPRQLHSLARSFATVNTGSPSRVPMSRLEPSSYIDYAQLDKNINVIRQRYVYVGVESWSRD